MRVTGVSEPDLLYPESPNAISKIFPESGKILLTGGGKDFVERIGIQAIKHAILSVLSGQNVRTQTEPLSRRRIAQVSGAIIAMFAQGHLLIPDFLKKLSGLAADQLKTSRENENKWPAQWVLGLTDKSVQNVLRSDSGEYTNYIKDFESAISDAAKHCAEQFGEYKLTLHFADNNGKDHQFILDWEGITRLTTAIGAQTLTIRGSDKSMYGKLFERLIMGTVLTLLGFTRVDRSTIKNTNGVFWLSDDSDNRESDATLIVAPGRIARFDIGFIGPGNPEISKDKLSRYGNVAEMDGGSTSSSVTFIVVDRLPETSKTMAAAAKIGAEIVQMSMQYWPRELATKLKERFNYEHEILVMTDHELQEYLKERIDNIQVQDFLSNLTVEKIAEAGVEEISKGEASAVVDDDGDDE